MERKKGKNGDFFKMNGTIYIPDENMAPHLINVLKLNIHI